MWGKLLYTDARAILIFASGNLVCTVAKKEQDVYKAVHKLHASLEEQNLIFYE